MATPKPLESDLGQPREATRSLCVDISVHVHKHASRMAILSGVPLKRFVEEVLARSDILAPDAASSTGRASELESRQQ